MKILRAVDLFCGAGGSSTGLARACVSANVELDLLAINHWTVAIKTHSKNHPSHRHLCESADNVDPRKAIPGGHLDILVASPECTHHSIARGGKPIHDQSRASAWHILRWAEAIRIDRILIENVPEFQTWGPLGVNNRPLKSRRGETYRAFIAALESLGYKVEARLLISADYGDPTTRKRLFIQAARGRRKITWPEPTHFPVSENRNLLKLKPWTPARSIIDFDIPSHSIFTRVQDGKKALAPATIERIAAGLRKFCGQYAEPFLVVLRNHADAQSLNNPVPTVTASGNHMGVCEPFVLGQQSGAQPRSVDQPIPTVAAAGSISLVEPFIIPQFSEASPRSVDKPLGTVTTTSRGVGLCEPFMVPFYGENGNQKPRCHSLSEPFPTVPGSTVHALVEPFVMGHPRTGGPALRSVDKPLATVTAKNANFSLIEPHIIALNHGDGDKRSYPLGKPMPTVTGVDAWGLVDPMIVKYNGTADAISIDEPLDSVTAKDRFALVECQYVDPASGEIRTGVKVPGTDLIIDIRFRMLQPKELARAQGFPDDYQFTGNREDRVRQIGNAVTVGLAEALCREMIA